jgi:hypothetical protein
VGASDWIGTIIDMTIFVLSTLAIVYFVYLKVKLSRKVTPVEQEENKKPNHDISI